jgi:hypothetical protein
MEWRLANAKHPVVKVQHHIAMMFTFVDSIVDLAAKPSAQ